jgi:Protein of unknown function (DUF3224)
MSDQSRIHHAQSPTRLRARAKIAVQSSEAEPYDQTASPALVEVRLTETFAGDIEGESPVRALQILRDDKSAVSVQRFRGKLGGRRGPSCFKGRKSSRTARSGLDGLSSPDREQLNFPGSAGRAALKASLAKGPTERWTIGSNDEALLLPTACERIGQLVRCLLRSRPRQVGQAVTHPFPGRPRSLCSAPSHPFPRLCSRPRALGG